jgi:hypothetical protein
LAISRVDTPFAASILAVVLRSARREAATGANPDRRARWPQPKVIVAKPAPLASGNGNHVPSIEDDRGE